MRNGRMKGERKEVRDGGSMVEGREGGEGGRVCALI